MTALWIALGRRKTSIAKVYIQPGTGKFIVNNKSLEKYFSSQIGDEDKIKIPLMLLGVLNQYDVTALVSGGGTSGQLDAIRLAISRWLCQTSSNSQFTLKKAGLLTCDSRIKERRKYGLKKHGKPRNIQSVKIKIMAKKNLHPAWYQSKVYCDGKIVLTVGATKAELHVDIWSGNHPFYTGSQKILDAEGRVKKFQNKYKSTNL